jgi:hypothetical protein
MMLFEKFFWEFFQGHIRGTLFLKKFFWEIFQGHIRGCPIFKKIFLGNFWLKIFCLMGKLKSSMFAGVKF